jgi:hypothetical protein
MRYAPQKSAEHQATANSDSLNPSASINPAEVTKSLRSKGIPSKKANILAQAITARLTGQELTNTQRDLLRSEITSPTVQSVISNAMKKLGNRIDSVQNRMYDRENIGNVLTNEENSASWNLSDQSIDTYSNHDYTTAPEDSAHHQGRNTFSDGAPVDGTGATGKIVTDGSHLENGKLKPNVTYKTGEHDYYYTTNEEGLIVNARTDDLQFKTHEGRLDHNPNTYGKEAGDHAGHLIGDRFGGSPELDNLVSQAENVNRSEYRKIEEQWAKALRNGQKVQLNIDIHYDQGGVRPSSFDVTYTIDGVQHRQKICNQ